MTSSTADVLWRQDADSPQLEITTALILPHGASPKDLSVAVTEGGHLLCVKYKEAKLVSWKLWRAVKFGGNEDLQWLMEGGKICIELVKAEKEPWSQLVNWTLPTTDAGFVDESTLDAMYAAEVPPLPAPKPSVDKTSDSSSWDKVDAAEGESPKKDAVNIDDVLDEVAEAEEAEKKEKEQEDAGKAPEIDLDNMLDEMEAEQHPVVKLELKGLEEEAAEISKKTKDYTEQLATGKNEKGEDIETDEKTELARRLEVLTKLAGFNRQMREVRSRPSTVQNFFEHQRIEIAKGRCNAGDLDESEVEMYNNEEERQMDGEELLEKGMASLQVKSKEAFFEGLRFLRLAALHKNSAHASVILFNLYTEMNEHAKGCFFIARRAQMEDCEPMTNSLAGSLHDEGVRLFPPWIALSVYYHQRAASSGSASSMLQLANLWQRGCTNGAKELLSNPEHAKLALKNSDAKKFLRWIGHAEARASGSAFFAKCQLHMTGDLDECEQSYTKAAKYWKRALAAMPEFKQLAPRVEPQLEALKQKMGQASPTDIKAPTFGNTGPGGVKNAMVKSDAPASPPTPAGAAPRSASNMMGRNTMGSKLGALEARSGNAHANMDQSGPQGGDGGRAQANGAGNKRFWERTVTTGIACFSIYTLLFPLRVMLLPQFYMAIDALKGMVLGGLMGGGGRRQQVGMGY